MKNTKIKNGVVIHLIITAVLGFVFWIIGEVFFPVLTEKMWTPLGIALYFLAFALLILIAFFVLSVMKTDASKKENQRNIKDGYVVGAIIIVAVVLFSCLFEFLYELGGQDVYEHTSYIFLIDDSGSMEGTEDIRAEAIKDVMQNVDMDKPYAVYKFADSAVQVKPMDYYDEGDEKSLVFDSMGGTEILQSTETVLEDLKNGNIANAGSFPKVLLVSDGSSRSVGLRRVTRKCRNYGVSVSTIGVGNCAEGLLQKIADNTGGVFVRCNDVSQLADSFEQAKAINTDRNLLSERFVLQNDSLYAFLRIAFLGLLGVAWSFAKSSIIFGDREQLNKSICFSIVCCTVGVLLIELLSGSAVNMKFLRLIFCVLWAITYGAINTRKTGPGAEYGPSKFVQSDLTGIGGETNDRIGFNEKGNETVKGLIFNDLATQTTNQQTETPFAENPFATGTNWSNNNNNGLIPNGFGNDAFSSPFGDGSSNPFGSSDK